MAKKKTAKKKTDWKKYSKELNEENVQLQKIIDNLKEEREENFKILDEIKSFVKKIVIETIEDGEVDEQIESVADGIVDGLYVSR